MPPPPPGGRIVLPLRLGVPAAFGKEAIDNGQRAVAADEEPEAFAVCFAWPFARPRLAARIVRVEADAAECLPAAMRAPFHVASVLVFLADSRAAIGTVFHRVRSRGRVRMFTTFDPVGGCYRPARILTILSCPLIRASRRAAT
jgi:hypothetical protein